MQPVFTHVGKLIDRLPESKALILRRTKAQIQDHSKMLYYYGLPGDLIATLKILLPHFNTGSQELQEPAVGQPSSSKKYPLFEKTDLSTTVNIGNKKAVYTEYPKISIITPNLNQATALEKTIQSVLLQNYPNLEYIIIDRGSTDSSLSIIEKYEKNLYHWESGEDGSDVDAINKGLEYATGTIFNWLNPDDHLEYNALFRCARAWQEDPSAAAWVGAARQIDPSGSVLKLIFPNGLDREDLGLNWNGGQFYQASCFLSTSKIKEAGGVSSDHGALSGLDLWLRLLEKGRFQPARGVWSNTLVQTHAHSDQSGGGIPGITRLKEKYGFSANANIQLKTRYKGRKLIYTIPPELDTKLKKAGEFYSSGSAFDSPQDVIVMGYSLPHFDKKSSAFRVFSILKILLKGGCRIRYIYSSKYSDDAMYVKALEGDIKFVHLPLNQKDYIKSLNDKRPRHVWITELWRIDFVKFMAGLIEELKKQPLSLKVTVDTVDFHYKEFYRKYEWDRKPENLALANEFLKNEKVLYKMADTVVVVSDDERKDIQKSIRSIKQIEVIPNIHEVPEYFRPWRKRRNICFVGNFGNRHNVDAVKHFLQNIFPLILKRNPGVEFHVLGYLARKYKSTFTFANPNVRVVGAIKNLQKALTCYKLFVCPMTYGAGMKGKIGDAIVVGVPVVTTPIGAEGFPVTDGTECFIADSPEEFGEKCNQVLMDPILWHNFAIKSRLMIAENFTPAVVAQKLSKLLY